MSCDKNNKESTPKITRRGFVQSTALGVGGLVASPLPASQLTTGVIEKRLAELNISLPPFSPPVANYASYRIVGDMVYIAGIGPAPIDGAQLTGALGKDLSVEQGAYAAERAALNIISQAKSACQGNLDRIAQWVRLTGYVHSADDFFQQPLVMNGASDLLLKIFAKKGLHARAALGVNTLPFNIAVEIEASFQLLGTDPHG